MLYVFLVKHWLIQGEKTITSVSIIRNKDQSMKQWNNRKQKTSAGVNPCSTLRQENPGTICPTPVDATHSWALHRAEQQSWQPRNWPHQRSTPRRRVSPQDYSDALPEQLSEMQPWAIHLEPEVNRTPCHPLAGLGSGQEDHRASILLSEARPAVCNHQKGQFWRRRCLV